MTPVRTTTPITVEPARKAVYFRMVRNEGNLRFGRGDPGTAYALAGVVENALEDTSIQLARGII
jgi:hypothetical protein